MKTAEYAVVPPATSRRNVAYTNHVNTIAIAIKTTSAINGPRNFMGTPHGLWNIHNDTIRFVSILSNREI
ncbi:hypothetical protein CCUG62472_04731 [Mycobacteroides salmoniphilum]|nr:hypothetical protein CCUG62472_04731 [Mycobacteroides salmoniphilum]